MEVRQVAQDRYGLRNSHNQIVLHETEHANMEARIAIALMERWGMVAAMEDGEDSAGRAKLRLSTEEEVVKRACDCAEMAVEEFRRRGWMVPGPSWDELEVKNHDEEETGNKPRR